MLISFINIQIFVSGGKVNQIFTSLNINNKRIRSINLIFIDNISQRLVVMLIDDILSRHNQTIRIRIVRNRKRPSLIIDHFWHTNYVLQTVSEKDQSRTEWISNDDRVITSNIKIRYVHLRVIEVWSIDDITEHKLVIWAKVVYRDITDRHFLVDKVSICWK